MLEWWPNLGKQDRTAIFVYVKNIPDGISDYWKEAKFNKIDACQTGFFPHGNNFLLNSCFFPAVRKTLCPVYVSQIDGFCDFLRGNLADYTYS